LNPTRLKRCIYASPMPRSIGQLAILEPDDEYRVALLEINE
jgi:hypothetical protein